MEHSFSIAPNKRVYAIGDIHGYVDVLRDLHLKIDEDLKQSPIEKVTLIYLGDYIDRGPDSKGVIDLILSHQKTHSHIEHICLMGNHEDAMLEFINDPNGPRQDWVLWGGIEAMESYGMTIERDHKLVEVASELAKGLADALPELHLEFYKNLGLYHIEDGYMFAHAGLRPNVAHDKQTKRDLTYTRSPFLNHEELHPHYVVHGHTISPNKKADILSNRMNLDSGLYEGGPLSCGVFEGTSIKVLEAWQT